jgi:Protein of unknown function (DUF4240)
MTREDFWALIDSARSKRSGEPEEKLERVLESLTAEQLASFQQHFDELFDAAYQWKLWGAAYLIEGGCSDDGFTDFRYGLISQGRRVYEAALENPDTLVDIDEDISNESFGYVASRLYEEKGGKSLDRRSLAPSEPTGEEWDFDDEEENAQRLPRLQAKFGDGG